MVRACQTLSTNYDSSCSHVSSSLSWWWWCKVLTFVVAGTSPNEQVSSWSDNWMLYHWTRMISSWFYITNRLLSCTFPVISGDNPGVLGAVCPPYWIARMPVSLLGSMNIHYLYQPLQWWPGRDHLHKTTASFALLVIRGMFQCTVSKNFELLWQH